jgi:(3,5-dihydroxyphenyl)acetyl-CoA 1,2-dioxygenase
MESALLDALAASHPRGASVQAWAAGRPGVMHGDLDGDYERDAAQHSAFWLRGLELLSALPPKPQRSRPEQALAAHILHLSRDVRSRFLKVHGSTLYRRITDNLSTHRRVEDLAYAAAAAVPGLVPSRETVAAEGQLAQKDKDGHEIDQGLLFNRFLGERATGLHLCQAMLRPRAEALAALERLQREGRVELGKASVERRGQGGSMSSVVLLKNPRSLNAEDDTTIDDVETAVDLALLDPETGICVLRGDTIRGGKYDGQNVLCTGINLTRLYHGQIPYLWYLTRDLGVVSKIFRGLAVRPDGSDADEIFGTTLEKPWVAAVERFAIGGGCQYLLAMDYVLAASDAYMTLPARKEGIIPGAANLRLPRFVGDRLARQAVMYGRRIDCGSPEGRLICDEVVPPARIDTALAQVVERLTSSGIVSAAANRRAFRIAHEPLDAFRAYMAVYARDQAACHFSPALIHNLERHWNARQRAS